MSTHEERLRRHLWAVMANTPQAARLESAFTGDRKEFAGAAGAVAKLRADPERPFAPREVSRLEAIVLPKLRPVFDVVEDSFADPPAPWKLLSAARKKIETAIRAVGRVELDGLPGVPYGGTAFIVGPGLMLTNRHVAEFFTSGVGDRGLKFIAGRTVAVDLKQETGSSEIRRLKVRRVLMVHPYWDACLLEVTGLAASQPQLTLMARQPADFKKRDVAVIGYPAPDPYANLALQMQIFHGVFYKKRLQPGKTIGYKPVKSYSNQVESLAHDCSTLGGNSGSVVLDVKTGQAIGLHFAGAYLEANYSVPAWQLGNDPRIVDLGVKFSAKPAKGSAAPKWLSFWKSLDEPAAKKPGKKRARTESPAALDDSSLGSPAAPGDWAERAPADLMARSLAVDPERTTDALTATFGPDEGTRWRSYSRRTASKRG